MNDALSAMAAIAPGSRMNTFKQIDDDVGELGNDQMLEMMAGSFFPIASHGSPSPRGHPS